MADRFTAITGGWKLLGRPMVLLCVAVMLLYGCESVPMPDMPKFDFGLGKERPEVAVKQGYSKVNVRPTPSTEQPPVASLNGGDKVHLVEERGDWLQVTFFDTAGKEQTGWVYKYLVDGYDKPQGTVTPGVKTVEEPAAVPRPTADPASQGAPPGQELPKSKSVSPL